MLAAAEAATECVPLLLPAWEGAAEAPDDLFTLATRVHTLARGAGTEDAACTQRGIGEGGRGMHGMLQRP